MKGILNRGRNILVEILLAGILSFLFYSFQTEMTQEQIYLEVDVLVSQDDQFQLFYTDTIAYNQSHSVITNVSKNSSFQKVLFVLPTDSIISKFRLDPGNKPGVLQVRSIRLVSSQNNYTWTPDSILKHFVPNEYVELSNKGEYLLLKRHGLDPHIFLDQNIKKIYLEMVRSLNLYNSVIPAGWSVIVFFVVFVCLRITPYSNNIVLWFVKPSYPLLLIFLVFISIPLFNLLIPILPETEDYEKREKRTLPEFNLAALTSYPERFTDYFNDNFGFRSLLTKLNSAFKTQLLRSSPLPEKVVLGKDNWLFLSDSFDKNYSAKPLFTTKELNEIYNSVAERSRILKRMGIDYYVLILPDKSVIYPEYLPQAYRDRNVHARMDQLMGKLAEDKEIKVIDPRVLLKQAKKKYELYYSSDTHWNIYAGMLLYDELIRTIQKDHPDVSTRSFSDFNFIERYEAGGDLADLMNIPELYSKRVLLPRLNNQKTIFDMKEMTVKYQEGFTHVNPGKTDGKKVLLYHDSFGLFFIKRMKEDFSESSFYWKPDFSIQDVETHKPDIVIHEVVTRFITNLKE
jgi:alginate O-acetyltransferase complex protein AlgJ